ncbi:magnesium/cobalt transporter CorA [Staphylococcus gallinarum]|uniref:magnesium/cobalt transporter CorA n=1 Tax=Staphylococcus gallinarum TaxID=1293 RepID=UPI001E4CF5B8|nr:magnesium/cobalt transporter CorA [Staphylococcus gallinarum]MCD8900119.1 magnesium/cobalt transporter CorA [Staphylococcus gallinarum]MCD8910473.1 magnesium/cobalt transporter CorA [Staphylococcus gallinarum]MCD8920433.1 magnesium/cobalt transporter CorA [Staphylococcus gallinarum]MEB6237859.1 magnesium/cobalt transporter CorA [Staphylococcus gallinarum]MEB6278445.1 magnesium/cobalt transporter CorA [Staphylococcus gallinarum]
MSMTIKYQTAKQRLQQVDQIETIPKDATLIWCDFTEPTAADNEILQSYFNFNKLEIDDTVNGTPRAKYKAYDTYQYIVFHSVTHDNTIKALNLFIKDNMLITYHHKPFAILSDVEQLITEHFQPDLDTSDLVLHILDKMVDSYFKPITEIEDKVYAFEDHQVDESTNKTVMDKVYKIRSQIIQIKRIIYPMRELVDDLKESHILLVDNKNHMYIQHIDDHLIKQVNILKIAQEMTNEIRDNYSSYTSYKMNSVMQVLTLVSVIFLPLTLVTGIYGMNFTNMPELKWHYGYYMVLCLMLFISIACIIYFKRKKWF